MLQDPQPAGSSGNSDEAVKRTHTMQTAAVLIFHGRTVVRSHIATKLMFARECSVEVFIH